jgi:DNA-binding transcriptional LysR family regulator
MPAGTAETAVELTELRVFLRVASERSFSRAALKLHRTQPAVSQAVRRLEDSIGERLFDRATKDATLTEAGRLLRDYAERLLRLSDEAEAAIRELRDLRRGRVLIGANEASVHVVLPLVHRFREAHPLVHVDVRRVPARQIGAEVANANLDFGVLTFQPVEPRLATIVLGQDELVMLVHPAHPLAHAREVTLAECARHPVIAHNDPSHVRDRVLRVFEEHHIPANILVSLPSLEGIKRAVGMRMGVALLPRRCAEAEIARGELVALTMPEIRLRRQVRFVYRRTGERSHAAAAFLAIVEERRGARRPSDRRAPAADAANTPEPV